MPLHIQRLQKSKSWARCERRPELAFYLMNLWMRSWHEVPAGSLENDDDMLASAARCPPNLWPKLRDDLMAGWLLKRGRWHHAVVQEIAADALKRRYFYAKNSARKLDISQSEWLQLRNTVFERDQFTCNYCGLKPTLLECDHVFPLSRGGKSTADNLATACKPCNRSKGAKTLDEWLN